MVNIWWRLELEVKYESKRLGFFKEVDNEILQCSQVPICANRKKVNVGTCVILPCLYWSIPSFDFDGKASKFR